MGRGTYTFDIVSLKSIFTDLLSTQVLHSTALPVEPKKSKKSKKKSKKSKSK